MLAKGGNMMCKLKGYMLKAGYCNVQMKRWIHKGIMMCKLKRG